MTELEKLDAGLPYCFLDEEVAARKESAVILCRQFNDCDPTDHEGQLKILDQLFGSHGPGLNLQQGFHCDYGKNIHVGRNFLTNYNVTILDIREVNIGNDCMIGPNTMITTVGHPLDAKGRRDRIGIAKPVNIGDDVWIGGNVTILPGVTIGNNVVIGAGAVVTKDVPDNVVVAGVPAKVVKHLDPEEQ